MLGNLGSIHKEVKMAKHCIYCKCELDVNSVVDVCMRCGHAVWGEKMFKAIRENMEGARNSGSLEQGSISTGPNFRVSDKLR
jgi:rRNA maturation endonuclease Nob1